MINVPLLFPLPALATLPVCLSHREKTETGKKKPEMTRKKTGVSCVL